MILPQLITMTVLEVVHEFTYLGSTIADLSLETELNNMHRERCYHTVQAHKVSIKQQQADCEHQNASVQSLHPQHVPLWQ